MSRQGGAGRKAARGEYIETDSGNKVSRKASISGTPSITLAGRAVIQSEVVLRGDLHRLQAPSSETGAGAPLPGKSSSQAAAAPTSINIGKYTVISTGAVLRPPSRVSRGVVQYYPMKVGDNVFIGPGAVISSVSIASHVHIGDRAVLHPFSIIGPNAKVLPDTIVPAQMLVPAGCVVGGQPARVVGEVGEGWGVSAGGGGGGGGGGPGWVEGGELRELVRSIK